MAKNIFPVLRVVCGSAALWLVSQWSIDLPGLEVPITLQTLVVFSLPLLLPRWEGVIAVALWLITGFAGLPVFSSGAGGWQIITSPSGPFLIGFLVIAFILALFRPKLESTVFTDLGIFFGAHVLILVGGFGTLWVQGNLNIDLQKHLVALLPGLIIKSILGAALLKLLRTLKRQMHV